MGIEVGDGVGDAVGDEVGTGVGTGVGEKEGTFVGIAVGDGVGLAVGCAPVTVMLYEPQFGTRNVVLRAEATKIFLRITKHMLIYKYQ